MVAWTRVNKTCNCDTYSVPPLIHSHLFIGIDLLEEFYPVGQNLAMSATQPDQPVMKDPEAIADMAKSQWFDKEANNGAYYGWMKMINNFDLGETSYVHFTVNFILWKAYGIDFFSQKFRSFSAHEVGHFTQFVRAEARKIGKFWTNFEKQPSPIAHLNEFDNIK